MPDEPTTTEPLRHAIAHATRRLRQRRALRYGATGFLAGSLIGFAVAVAITARWISETSLPGYGAFLFLPTLVGLVAGVSYSVLGKYDPVWVARLLEKRLDLKDRLSTALAKPKGDAPVVAAQSADASRHVPTDAHVRDAVPLTPVPRRVYVAGAVGLAVVLTYFAPDLPVFWNPTIRAEQVAVKKEGERLLAVAKAAAAEAKKQNLPDAEKAAKEVEKLGKEMARGRMPLKEALVKRAKLGEELEKARQKIAREQANRVTEKSRADLQNAGKDTAKAQADGGVAPGATPPAASPDARMKALQDAMARGDKSGAAAALREMADAADRGEPKPGAERDKTGQQLTALGDSLEKNNLPEAGKSAQNAGNAMNRDAMPEAAQSLRDAADKLEQSSAKNNESGEKSAGQTGSSSQSGAAKSGEQSALEKMAGQVQKQTGAGASGQSQSGSQQSGQSAQSSQANKPAQGGSQSQGGMQKSPSAQNGSQPQSGQGGKSGQGSQPGQAGSSSKKPGSGVGQGRGKSAGIGNANKGGSAKGSGSGSSGSAKTGSEASRLAKGAREQNIRGKKSGDGPETIITEADRDRSGLPVSSLPYYKEFVQKRGTPASESAQNADTVPSAYRKEVRGYFDAPPKPAGTKGQ